MADASDESPQAIPDPKPIQRSHEPLYIASAPVLRYDAMWHDAHENLLKTWRRQASINMWLQTASSYYYRRMNGYLAYPSILLSAVTSIGVFGIDTCNNALGGKYITSCMSLASAFLIGINKHAQAAEKAQEFMLRSRDFYSMIRDIDVLLSTPKEERGTCSEIMTRMRSEFDRILNMSLDPPHHIILQYEKKFRALEQDLYDLHFKDDDQEHAAQTPQHKRQPDTAGQVEIHVDRDSRPAPNSPIYRMKNPTTTAGLSEAAETMVSQYVATNQGMMQQPPPQYYGSSKSSNRYNQAAFKKRVQKVILSPYQLYDIPLPPQGSPYTEKLPTAHRLGSFSYFQKLPRRTGETAAAYLQSALSGAVDITSQRGNTKSGQLPVGGMNASPFIGAALYGRGSVDNAGKAPHELVSNLSNPPSSTNNNPGAIHKAITTLIGDTPHNVFNNLMHRTSAGGESTQTDRRRSREVNSLVNTHRASISRHLPPPIILPQQSTSPNTLPDEDEAQDTSNKNPAQKQDDEQDLIRVAKVASELDRDWEIGESRDNFEVSLTLNRGTNNGK